MTRQIATATVPSPNTWNNDAGSNESFTSCPLNGWVEKDSCEFHSPWKSQGNTKIWSDCSSSPSYKGGDSPPDCYGITGNAHGLRAALYTTDKYNSGGSSHNGAFRIMWPKYPFAARALSFDFTRRDSSTGWGMLNMWMLYEKADGSDKSMASIDIHEGCTTRADSSSDVKRMSFSGKDKLTSNWEDIDGSGFHDWSYSGRGHFIGGHNESKYDDYYCVGIAGVYVLSRLASSKRQHGMDFNNLYLMPSMDATKRWCGGFANGEINKKRLVLR